MNLPAFVPQWIEPRLVKCEVAGSIASAGTEDVHKTKVKPLKSSVGVESKLCKIIITVYNLHFIFYYVRPISYTEHIDHVEKNSHQEFSYFDVLQVLPPYYKYITTLFFLF